MTLTHNGSIYQMIVYHKFNNAATGTRGGSAHIIKEDQSKMAAGMAFDNKFKVFC